MEKKKNKPQKTEQDVKRKRKKKKVDPLGSPRVEL